MDAAKLSLVSRQAPHTPPSAQKPVSGDFSNTPTGRNAGLDAGGAKAGTPASEPSTPAKNPFAETNSDLAKLVKEALSPTDQAVARSASPATGAEPKVASKDQDRAVSPAGPDGQQPANEAQTPAQHTEPSEKTFPASRKGDLWEAPGKQTVRMFDEL